MWLSIEYKWLSIEYNKIRPTSVPEDHSVSLFRDFVDRIDTVGKVKIDSKSDANNTKIVRFPTVSKDQTDFTNSIRFWTEVNSRISTTLLIRQSTNDSVNWFLLEHQKQPKCHTFWDDPLNLS